MKVVVAIDPSINYCGYAVYVETDKWRLQEKGLFKPDKGIEDEVKKADNIYEKCKKLLYDIGSGLHLAGELNKESIILVVENPAHWSTGGYHARESGNLQKLILLVGKLSTLCVNTVLVHPHEWKGQLTKPVCRNRMVRNFERAGAKQLAIEMETLNHNIMDAVSIGYWYIFRKPKGKMI